jgi:glycosyltransferase involved in cell wall biosynthesis
VASTKCLIYECDVSGHRLQHVRHLTDALLSIGCDVTMVLLENAREREEFRVHLAPIESQFELQAVLPAGPLKNFFSAKQRVQEILAANARVEPDWVYVPLADMLTQAAAVHSLVHGSGEFRRRPIEAQVMRGRYAYPAKSLKARAGCFASRSLMLHSPWRVTHILDTLVYDNLRSSSTTTEYRLIPEPVEELPPVDRFEARKALGIPTDGRYVASVGGMGPRKGIDLLLAAFARAKLQADDRMLLVGKMAPPIREMIARDYGDLVRAGRLLTVDRYVSDFELGCGFLAGDVLVTPHPRQIGSSGTLVRSVAANRPIVASDFGWVGWVTEKFGLGKAVRVEDTNAFAAALESMIVKSSADAMSEGARRFKQYHTVHNQKAHWVALLGEQLGLPLGELANRVDWQWVLDAPP